MSGGCFRQGAGGLELFVRLTPKAARDAVEGCGSSADGAVHLKARVRAVPEKGKANAALEKLVARWLGVPASTVSVTAGGTSRLKTVTISGDGEALARHVQQLAGEN